MKDIKIILFTLLVSSFFSSCKENEDILAYDQNQSYVYFGIPNPDTKATEKYTDSIYYSFATDEEIGLQHKKIAIPVRIAGNVSSTDRTYGFEISSSSEINKDLVSFSEPIVKAGQLVDTLYINLQRGEELATKEMTLLLDLSPTADFKVGHQHNGKIKIIFSDILTEPSWWKTWQSYFGPFHKEVFQQWMQIYYLGADPTPEVVDNIPPPYYYWNRMPKSVVPSSNPATFVFIDHLRQYFQANVVYPNGDSTQPRILLP